MAGARSLPVSPVLRHVPKAARGLWAQCLARALGAVAHHNTLAAWRELLMLPKAVLRPAPRGGALRRVQAAQFTARRCSRWLAGGRDELLEAYHARRPPPPPPSDEDHFDPAVAARCCALASDGELSRACAALATPPLLSKNAGVLQKLREKHPRAGPARPALVPLGPPNQAAVPDITGEHLRRAIQTWSRSSAPGPTGLRGDHLRQASGTAHADEVVTQLCAVVQLLAPGEGPAELAPHLAGATLHALPKGAEDVLSDPALSAKPSGG